LFSAVRTLRFASLSPHSRPLAGLTSVPSRTSSLRKSMNCAMRLANSSNCAASSLRTFLRQSLTTAAIRSLNLSSRSP
jgi:hypothetical protein